MHEKRVLHIFVKKLFKKNYPITEQVAFRRNKKVFSYIFLHVFCMNMGIHYLYLISDSSWIVFSATEKSTTLKILGSSY